MQPSVEPSPGRATPDDESSGLSRRQLLERLAVGGAIVWSAPLISSPAYAAGPASCVNSTLDWNTLGTPGTTFSSATVAGVTITLNPSTFYGGTTALGTNRTIIASPIGGIATQGVQFEQTPINGGGQNISFTFSRAVYNVSFTIADIDTVTGNWSDRVIVVSPSTFTYSMPTGSTVIGAGTSTGTTTTTGPFRNSNNNLNYSNSQNGGNVTITFPGPLTTFQMKFQCDTISGGSNQLIKISPIGFCG